MIEKEVLENLLHMEEYVFQSNDTGEDYDAINIEYILRQAMDSISRIRKMNYSRFLNEAKTKRTTEIGDYRVFHGKRRLYDYSNIRAWQAMNEAITVMLENKKDLEHQLRQNTGNSDLDDSVKPFVEVKEYAYLRIKNNDITLKINNDN